MHYMDKNGNTNYMLDNDIGFICTTSGRILSPRDEIVLGIEPVYTAREKLVFRLFFIVPIVLLAVFLIAA